ncbi:MAG: NUDIX hydrolase [Kiritimatiellia bacterium]
MRWLTSLQELQSIAQAGLAYPGDRFDKERFTRLRELCAHMMAEVADLPTAKVMDLFCNETGFQTPKVDTRAFIYKDGRVLLVKETNGRWSLPGGWCEVMLTPTENTVKEAYEEAGAIITVERLLLAHTYAKHNHPPLGYGVLKLFFFCHCQSVTFQPNLETTATEWFSPDELPPLCENKNTLEQIRQCFLQAQDGTLPTDFD